MIYSLAANEIPRTLGGRMMRGLWCSTRLWLAGGVVFFSFDTSHTTRPNPTADGRAGVGIHFVNFDYANADMHTAQRWQQAFLTGRNASSGEREYGEQISFAEELAATAGWSSRHKPDTRQSIAIPK